MEKPGYKTTEFWITILTTTVSILLTAGIINSEEADTLNAAVVQIVGLMATIVPIIVVIGKYIDSRTQIKLNK